MIGSDAGECHDLWHNETGQTHSCTSCGGRHPDPTVQITEPYFCIIVCYSKHSHLREKR